MKDTVRVPYFSEPGVRYAIGRVSTVVAFFFPDSATGVRETASLDQLTLSPPGDSLGAWPGVPAEVVRSVNLVAVLFDVTDRQAERLRLAITAGAPQPHTVAAP